MRIKNSAEQALSLKDIIHRDMSPKPWSEGEKIPWDNAEFSERMLREHLSQAHDAASRRRSKIKQHIRWIHEKILDGNVSRVLDLACGPGLYCARLTKLGHACFGIDFSPASITYASKHAPTGCSYIQGDIRTTKYGDNFHLVMLIYGEFNVFHRADARNILEKSFQALAKGGKILLEVSSFESLHDLGNQPAVWYSENSGVFSDRPYICLMENFWQPRQKVAMERYWILHSQTGTVVRHTACSQAYTNKEYTKLLTDIGFTAISFHPSLTGKDEPDPDGQIVILAGK